MPEGTPVLGDVASLTQAKWRSKKRSIKQNTKEIGPKFDGSTPFGVAAK